MITDKKKSLNEYRYMSGGSVNKTINDPDLYVFATQVIVPLCMKYAKYAFYAKVKASAIKGRNGSDLHRAAFKMELQSLNSQAKSLHRVLCKIYNTNKLDDTIVIDYNAIADGYYDYFASIIDGTVYFTPLSELYRYQAEMGNVCITKGGKFMAVAADYFIEHSSNSYEMDQADIAAYDKAFDRYVNKSYKVTENYHMNENFNWDANIQRDTLPEDKQAELMHALVDIICNNTNIEPDHDINTAQKAFQHICKIVADEANVSIQEVCATCIVNNYINHMMVWAFRRTCKNATLAGKVTNLLITRFAHNTLYEIYVNGHILESKKRVTSKEKALLEKLSKLTGIRSKSFNEQVLDVIRNR